MVFSTIVVGVDGGPGGVDAMALARRLAAPTSELIAVAIAAVDPHPSAKTDPGFDRAAREEAHERLTDLRQQEPQLRTEVLRSRWVSDGLHRAATRFEADLVVIGSCHRGPIGRAFAGDDTRETLRDAPCPVAVAMRDYALHDAPIKTIGLGWAQDTGSDGALVLSQALARELGAQLHALTVVKPGHSPMVQGRPTAAAVAEEEARVVAHLARLSDVEVLAATGDAVDELLALAAEVDLLVVGSRQRGPLERLLLGSASEQLTRRSARPLLVVASAAPRRRRAPQARVA